MYADDRITNITQEFTSQGLMLGGVTSSPFDFDVSPSESAEIFRFLDRSIDHSQLIGLCKQTTKSTVFG